jgi:hypothetical protein
MFFVDHKVDKKKVFDINAENLRGVARRALEEVISEGVHEYC